MRRWVYLILTLFLVVFTACEKITDPVEKTGSITAKENVDKILQKAKLDFAVDAQLAAIYGWNVDTSGNINLLESDNAFVYVVQSTQLQENEFYIPVYAAGPVKSPINFTSMLSLIKDTTASGILDNVFGRLATVYIDPNAVYKDSPAAIDTALAHGGTSFITQNPGSKIDMYLVPGKSIDTMLSITNSADWIINFRSDTKSLVLWINSNSGVVTKLSGN